MAKKVVIPDAPSTCRVMYVHAIKGDTEISLPIWGADADGNPTDENQHIQAGQCAAHLREHGWYTITEATLDQVASAEVALGDAIAKVAEHDPARLRAMFPHLVVSNGKVWSKRPPRITTETVNKQHPHYSAKLALEQAGGA